MPGTAYGKAYIDGPFHPRRLRQIHRGTLILGYSIVTATAGLIIALLGPSVADPLPQRWGVILLALGCIGVAVGAHQYAHGLVESIEGSQPERPPERRG